MSARLAATNAAEGLPRRRFTVDEVMEMTRTGIIQEHEQVELIGWEFVPIVTRKARIHRDPSSAGYRDVQDHGPDVRLVPLKLPATPSSSPT